MVEDGAATELAETVGSLRLVARLERDAQAVKLAQLPVAVHAVGEAQTKRAPCRTRGRDDARCEAPAEVPLRGEFLSEVGECGKLEIYVAGERGGVGAHWDVLVPEVAVRRAGSEYCSMA